MAARARPAAAPFRPDTKLNLALGLCFGLLLGVGVALLVLGALLFAVPLPSHTVAEGVVWAPEDSLVRAGTAGFVERLVAFWSNHFCVSAAKGQVVRASAGAVFSVPVLLAGPRELARERFEMLLADAGGQPGRSPARHNHVEPVARHGYHPRDLVSLHHPASPV